MQSSVPIVRDLVLLGGGHTHTLLIRRWAMNPMVGVRLTLISESVLTPYSGMLPGYIAGHYSLEDMHIDLARLCSWAGVQFITARASGIDLQGQSVLFPDRPPIDYDLLSVDTGSTPDLNSVTGADLYTIPVKPISQFRSHWLDLYRRQKTNRTAIDIGVVGSGVGGFELLLSVHHALSQSLPDGQGSGLRNRFHWIVRGSKPLSNRPAAAREKALAVCRDRGIQVHTNFDVVEVQEDRLLSRNGNSLALGEIIWCTGAAAPQWVREAGFTTDSRGFIATNQFLQSVSHHNVFATGDVGTQIETPVEKAGVYAVRQAPALYSNLRNFLQGTPLKPYVPQKRILNLMALGEKSAIATRGALTLSGDWVWQWKHYIDQKFMNRFIHLEPRSMAAPELSKMPAALLSEIAAHGNHATFRCGGCAAKVPAAVLESVLSRVKSHTSVQSGETLASTEDAAVINVSSPLVQSVDQFRAMIDDAWIFGRIAALHAMNDMFALGAKPQSAQALVGLPYSVPSVQARDLWQLMSGALHEFDRHDCALIGGHTSESAEMTLGFVINGEARTPMSPGISAGDQAGFMHHAALRAGDNLILTKPIGTGVVMAAHMNSSARGEWVQQTIQHMLHSNAIAAEILSHYGCQAATDVTGFGLLGHLLNMLRSSGLAAELSLSAIPAIDGAIELSDQGIISSLSPSNRGFQRFIDPASPAGSDRAEDSHRVMYELLLDPQTSGGLLAGIGSDQVDACLIALREAGYSSAAGIGRCRSLGETDADYRITLTH